MTDTRDPFGANVRICGMHMARMKSALQDLSLWPRVSLTPEHLRDRLSKNNPYDPDPMMLLHNMLIGKARHTAALNEAELPQGCPLCLFAVGHWIDEAAPAVAARLATLDAEAAAQRAQNAELEAAART